MAGRPKADGPLRLLQNFEILYNGIRHARSGSTRVRTGPDCLIVGLTLRRVLLLLQYEPGIHIRMQYI